MRFSSLGSGSKGNASLIEAGNTLLLVDNGFSVRELQKRLCSIERSAEAISAILVTHEHGDHIKGVGALARRYEIPVYLTRGTFRGGNQSLAELPSIVFINSHEPFSIGDIRIRPITVPHDACEPCQFVFEYAGVRVGLLTDTGMITRHIIKMLNGCDALMLEFNHCSEMLGQSDYPAHLQERIAGRLGHLSNEQSCQLVSQLDTSRLQYLVAMHLSEQNNCPEKVHQLALGSIASTQVDVRVAMQNQALALMIATQAV